MARIEDIKPNPANRQKPHSGADYIRRPTPQPMRRIDIVNAWPSEPAGRSSEQTSRQLVIVGQERKTKAKKRRSRAKKSSVLYILSGLLLLVGAYFSINGYLANRRFAEQVNKLSDQTAAADDSSNNAPSTAPITGDAVKNYVVAPNLPKYIDIPSLSVHARVLSMGVDSKDALKSPGSVFDTGWYNASSQPGQPGGMLIDGHISSWSTKGVFYGLNKLKTGDTITITRGDDKQFTYKVVSSETKPVDQVDMASLLVSPDTSKPGLSLISCSGDVIPGTSEFDKRIMIRAVLAE